MGKTCRWFAVFLITAIAVPPCFAQAPAAPSQASPPATNGPKGGSNEMICQKIEVIGSRLGYKKVCMTRAQWADQQLQDRQATEKTQIQRTMPGQ